MLPSSELLFLKHRLSQKVIEFLLLFSHQLSIVHFHQFDNLLLPISLPSKSKKLEVKGGLEREAKKKGRTQTRKGDGEDVHLSNVAIVFVKIN